MARRLTVDLNDTADKEFERMQQITGLDTSDLLRNALTLLKIYIDEQARGNQFVIHQPNPVRIVLPISITLG